MSHECHGILNHWQFNCLLNSFLWMITKKHQNSVLLALCQENPPLTDGFPSQRANYVESISMLWCHHDLKSPGILSWCFICPPSPIYQCCIVHRATNMAATHSQVIDSSFLRWLAIWWRKQSWIDYSTFVICKYWWLLCLWSVICRIINERHQRCYLAEW